MITQNWKLIGIGLLIASFVRGCPQTIQHSPSLTEKTPLQSLATNRPSDSSDGIASPLFRTSKKSFVPTQLSQSGQLSSIVKNKPALNEKTQSTSPQLSTILAQEKQKTNFKKDQSISRNSDISGFQAKENRTPNFTNQDTEPPTEVKNLQDSQIEIKPQLIPDITSKALSENPSNPIERNIYSSTSSNTTSQNSQFSSPVISSSPKSTAGNCDYPWELDSTGNRCGDRAASEQPNLTPGSTSNQYSPSLSNRYSIPILSSGSTYVRSYTRKDGTYVRGHSRRKR